MKLVITALVVQFFLAELSIAAENDVDFRVETVRKFSNRHYTKNVSLQQIKIRSIKGVNKNAIKSINEKLSTLNEVFLKMVSECHNGAQGNPWGFRSKFEKARLSNRYVSFVFYRSTVCGGSTDFERDAFVFSKEGGKYITATELLSEIFPHEVAPTHNMHYKDITLLSQNLRESLINDSKAIYKDYDNFCDGYLRNISYRIWVEGKKLILFPEFSQPDSVCQREYIINLPEPVF